MGLVSESTQAGVLVERNQDSVTGLMTQNPESTKSSVAGVDTLAGVAYGQPFVLVARLGIASNSPAAATNYDALFFNKNAPWKFRVLSVNVLTLDVTAAEYTNADGGNLVLEVAHGDGEASETFTALFSADVDENVVANGIAYNQPGPTVSGVTWTEAQCEIEANDSLRARVTLDPDATAGATNDGGEFLFTITCMRVN